MCRPGEGEHPETATAPGVPTPRSVELRIVYAPIGLPWQDLAIVWPVYLSARHAHVPEIDLLA